MLLVYFFIKVVEYLVVNPIGDDIIEIQFLAVAETVDILLVAAMLFVLRAREWPQFFTLSLQTIEILRDINAVPG